jgi:DNA-directed RNA polymerase subunit RPC12/RpoP
MSTDEKVIVLCIRRADAKFEAEGSVDLQCVDCGETILRKPDPDVPPEAEYLCMQCGTKRIDESGEVPEIMITKLNQQTLERLGWALRTPDGHC